MGVGDLDLPLTDSDCDNDQTVSFIRDNVDHFELTYQMCTKKIVFISDQLQRTLPPMVVEILEEKLDQEFIKYSVDLMWEGFVGDDKNVVKKEPGREQVSKSFPGSIILSIYQHVLGPERDIYNRKYDKSVPNAFRPLSLSLQGLNQTKSVKYIVYIYQDE